MAKGKIAIVTGANQGLGLALVEGLAQQWATEDTIYLTARDVEKGKNALVSLPSYSPNLRFARLDVTEPSSIEQFADQIKTKHGGLDIVLSNAAARIAKNIPNREQVWQFIETNNLGTSRILKAFLPLLHKNGRLVVVASSFGQLHKLPSHLHPYFDITSAHYDDIDATMLQYVEKVEQECATEEGWPHWINIPSKIGQVASTKIAAREIAKKRPHDGILINAACPGLVDTEASRPWFDDMSSAQSPETAAKDVLWLTLLPAGLEAPAGQLVQFRKILPWL